MFLSNWLVFKIVLAALGRTDYPVAGDLELKYDNANKIYLSGGSLKYVDDATLWSTIGEETTSYGSIESLHLDASNEQILFADDHDTNTQLGYGCDIDGDYMIGGAPQDDEGGSAAGAAYIFKKMGASWIQTAKLIASDPDTNDQFGEFCEISGDYVIVGNYQEDAGGTSAGAAYIFKRDTGAETWTQQAKLMASDAASNDKLGWGVSINGDYAIAGAHSESSGAGAAYIFKRSGTTWSQEAKITADNAGGGDYFGYDVTISGDYAAVGSIYEDTTASDAGSVYIFKRSGTSWTQQQRIQSSDIASNDNFGCAVAMDGDYLAVSSPYDNSNYGAVYFFKKDSGAETWTQQTKIIPSDVGSNDQAGNIGSLSISGDTVVMGADRHDTGGTSDAGTAWVFKRSGATWSEVKKLSASDKGSGYRFGISVGVSGSTVLVGSAYADQYHTNNGALYVYNSQKITNYYINEIGKYSVDANIAGLNYKTNEVDVTSLNIPAKVVGISAGAGHAAALTEDGSVYMWGTGSSGRLGQGSSDTNNKHAPVQVKGVNGAGFLSNIKQISCGGTQTFALANDGTLYAWGTNGNGQLGVGDTTERYYPTVVPYTGEAISKVYAVHKHSLICTVTNGYVYACGENQSGQVGNGSTSSTVSSFTQVKGVGGTGNISGITHLAGGNDFSMILNATTGLAYGFGRGDEYQLSTGDNTSTNSTPRNVKTGGTTTNLTNIADISCGKDFSYFLIDDGTVYASGEGSDGQQGDGANSDNTSASACTGLSNIVNILGTRDCGFARKSDGTLYVWGKNDNGEFANGSTTGSHTPAAITSITGVEDIQSYGVGDDLIARKSDGSVWRWGYNNQGQIGNGTSGSDVYSPTQVIPGAGPSLDGKFNLFTSPSLAFDNYNKLSINHGLSSVSSKLFFGSNVYDIGTLTSDLTIETPGVYKSLTYDTTSNVAYFNKTTVGAIASTQKDFALDNTLYGTVQSGKDHGSSQGGFGNNTILNADGTRLLVTDPINYPSGRGRGYIFHWENGSWDLKQTWDNPDGNGQRFSDGACMNEDGTRIFLMHVSSSKVYTYEYASGAWPTANTGTHEISPGSTISAESSTLACNKAGDVLVIGYGNGNKVKIYRRSSATSWSIDSGGDLTYNRSVAINGAGTRAFMGHSDGKIYMVEWNGSTWSSATAIITTSGYSSHWAAAMMSDSAGETIILKAEGYATDSGIYERASNGTWSRAQGVEGKTQIYGTTYPSISYDGTMVLISNYHYDSDKGRAYLWQKSGGSWSLTKTLDNPHSSPSSNDYWGAGCGIARTTKDKFVIGFHGDNTAGTDYGSVWTYTNTIPNYFDFDTYNKILISGITPTSTSLKYLSNTYDIGTATNIYMKNTGTYEAAITASDKFALVSNTVSGTLTSPIDYTDIWAGEHAGMIVDSAGKLYTWGNNNHSESGRGASDRTPTHVSTISDPVSNVWMEGAPGRARIVKTSTDKWYMWGYIWNGSYVIPKIFGIQSQTSNQATPYDVTSHFTTHFGAQGASDSTRIIKVVMSSNACTALAANGKVWSWGHDGNRNELGKNTTNGSETTPFKNTDGSTELSNITDICSLHYGKLVLDSNGDVWRWGTLRTGSTGWATKQSDLDSINIIGIGASFFSAYAWDAAGNIYSVGQGTEGQLMNGASSDQDTTWQTVTALQGQTIYKIHGQGYSVLVHASGGIYVAGHGANGRLGLGNNNDQNTPVKNPTLSALSIYKISFGNYASYAITTDGKGYAWGGDTQNSIPTPLSGDQSTPVEASSITNLPLVLQNPSFDFDTLNKLSISGITPTSSTLTYGSNTYELGTKTDIYINDVGTYDIETKNATKFALRSNVVSGTITPYKEIAKIQDLLGEGSSHHFGMTDTEGTGSLAFSKDGTRLAVGAYHYSSSQGRTYIYTLSDGQYVLDSGMPLEGGSGQHMGYAININDDGTKIGLASANGLSARVYERSSGGSWSLRGSSFGSGTYWTKGVVLDASGNRALGAASGDNTLKLFDWNGSSAYTETTTFSGSGEFGCGFDMTRDGLTVIGINKNNSGNETVKAWKYASGSWSQLGSDIDVGAVNSWIHMARGTGTRFVVGTMNHDSLRGILKLYEYSGSSWSLKKEWTGYTSAVQFGYDSSISDDGTIIISGSTHDDTGSSGNDAGMIHIFTEKNGTWEEERFTGDYDSGHLGMGVSMSYDGSFYAACAPYDSEAFTHAGRVRIYQNKRVLDFDGYNKLSISGVTPTSTKLTFGENTYDIGTATDIYIENAGTYDAEINSASTPVLTSNVVGTVSSKPSVLPILKFENLGTSLASNVSGVNLVSESTYTAPTYDSTNNAIQTAANSSLVCDFSSVRTSTTSDLAVVFEAYFDHNEGLTAVVTLGEWSSSPNTDFSIDHRVGMGSPIGGISMHSTAYITDTSSYGSYKVNALLDASDYKDTWSKHALVHYERDAWWYIYVNGEWKLLMSSSQTTTSEVQNFFTDGFPSKIRVFRYPGQYGTGAYSTGTKVRNIEIYDDVSFIVSPPVIPPSLTHDGYKLVLKNFTPTSSTLKYESNTYDIGTATNVYIKDVGTYNIEAKNASTFVLASNVSSGTIKTVTPVITGGYFSAHALTYDGKLYGWGENSNGELGVGDTTDKTVPTLCTGIPQGEVVSIWEQSKRGESRWAKTKDGRIWVTGDHGNYNLPNSSGDYLTFTDVSAEFGDHTLTSNSVVWASGSERATQVLMENGDVWSYGNDSGAAGILGQGSSPTSDRTPRKLTGISNVTKMAYGGDLVMALDSSGNVYMWGSNDVGHGSPNWGAYNTPTNIMAIGTDDLTTLLSADSETVTDIYCSSYSMFVLTNKGTVYGTGKNGAGQLGQGNTAAKNSSDGWVKIDYFTSNAITVNKLYVGNAQGHVFADTSDGWYCWGKNGSGNHAVGHTTKAKTPIKFTGVSNIKTFGTGAETLYAITEDGNYYSWGSGANGARGDTASSGNITYTKYIDGLPNILAPSFEFDGYDKVFVGGTFVYEFYVSVKAAGSGGLHYVNINQLSSSTMTLKSNMVTVHVPSSSGSAADMFDGSNSTYISINDPNHEVGTKLWTLVTDKELADLTFVADRPVYMPGWKITCNGKIVLNDTTNGSTSTTPSPATFTKTLSLSGSMKFTKGTTTYDAGNTQIITVSDPGTYDAQLKKSGVFTLKSETVPTTTSTGLYTWAFHHGNFDNAYGDGDILTARDNGRFYADTPAYTGDIGTITPGATTTSNTTYTFAPPSGGLTANVLMVAGGGGGGGHIAGGGGAGGLVYTADTSLAQGATKTIVVGSGGNGGHSNSVSGNHADGYDGNDTTFTNLTTAVGGGAGGSYSDDGASDGNVGGSGGGGGHGTSGAAGTSNQGYAGGDSQGNHTAGGGGGAGGAGETPSSNSVASGNGGKGSNQSSVFGTFYGEGGWFAGGGGGGQRSSNGQNAGLGGKGGGGRGHNDQFHLGTYAKEHTGGGGGGCGDVTSSHLPYGGGKGGSGIVLIQTNVPTPNVNTEFKLPEHSGFVKFQYDRQRTWQGPVTPDNNTQTIKNVKLPDGSIGPVFYNNDIYTYMSISSHSDAEQGDGSWQTIESVFMPIETGNYTHIASLMHSDANLMTLGIDSNNKLIIQHNNNVSHNAVTTLATSDYTMEHGKWHHLVLTTDYLGNAKAYVNGYLVASGQWTSMNSDKAQAMFYRIGVDNHAERVYMASTSRAYFAELSPKEIMQLASSVGCGPKLEHDGLNTLKILNTEPGSTVRLFTSNVADTTNVFIVADPADSEYTIPEPGQYYAEIKGTDTFTITKTLDVSGTFPLYQYPPIDGTTSSLTQSSADNTWNTWTISGAAHGNGQYQCKADLPSGTTSANNHYNFLRNNVGSTNQWQTSTNPTYPIALIIQLPSAKKIRKYRMFPLDHANPNGSGTSATPGTSVDPTLPGNGGDDATKRPKSWVFKGSTDGTSWTDLDTVSDKPISIDGDLYSIDSPASYQYYQVSITANNGGNKLLLGDIQLWGDA